jgi:NitT/TauT family transport system permease protein
LRGEIANGRLAQDLAASLWRVGAGFVLAVMLGAPAGVWLGRHAGAQTALLPLVNFFRNLSPLAWIPFAILWFGIGDAPVIFLIFLASFFPVTLATLAAVASVPPVYYRVAEDYGFTRRERLWQVTLPAIAPQLMTALRVTIGVAWMVVVGAEMIAGRDGLGFAVWDARNGLRSDLLVANMIVIGVIGIALDWFLRRMAATPGISWGYGK